MQLHGALWETQGRPVSDLDSADQTEGGGLHARQPVVGLVLSRYACGKSGPEQSIFNLRRSDGRNVKITHLRRNEGCGCLVIVLAGITLHNKTSMVTIYQNLNATRFQKPILQPVAISHMSANRGKTLM